MRVIPVMDLLSGVVVHAVRGERERYRPVVSTLVDGSEPLTVARAFRDKLGLSEIYLADLDSIQGRGHHRAVIGSLAHKEKIRLMVDAGAADAQTAQSVLAAGADRVIVGVETLNAWDDLRGIRAVIPAERLVFSLDMRGGRVLSRSPELAARAPLDLLEELQRAGWREVILLDLARVGTGTGVDWALMAEARRRFPELALLAGGGIRGVIELEDLKALGVAGVLVATSMHHGVITRQQIAALSEATP